MDASTEALARALESTSDAKKQAQAIARFVDARTVEMLYSLRIGIANASDKVQAELAKGTPRAKLKPGK